MSDEPHQASRYLERPARSSLADVADTILDKGLVVDRCERISPVGLEVATRDERAVVATLDNYLRFAEAANNIVLGRSRRR